MPQRTVERVRVGNRALELSNLAKVYYPKTGFTKAEVIDYYLRIAPAMLPHLRHHPLNLKRYPEGVEGEFFFQKEAPVNTPDWLTTYRIWSDTKGERIRFTTASDTPSLIWLANTGNLEFHTLLSVGADPETPKWLVFDLDPGEGAGIIGSAAVALLVKDRLQDLGLKSFPKTSGGKGVQPYVPLNTPCTFEQTRDTSYELARGLERGHPDAIVTNMRKELRVGKVLVDYSQNSHHKSTVCVYSLRARPLPSVSTPLRWEEVEAAVDARDPAMLAFSPAQVLKRVERHGDLFEPVVKLKQHLPGREAKKPKAAQKPEAAAKRPKKRNTKQARTRADVRQAAS